MAKNEVKRDSLGNIDIDFYLQEARKERSAYVAQMSSAFVAKFKAAFRFAPAKLSPSH